MKGDYCMDLKDPLNKQELVQRIKGLSDEYREMLLQLVDSADTYKRAALLYYWLRDYKNYIKNEHTFDPRYYPVFERGNIINVNLGFNLGSETGGLHYALVLRNSNRRDPVLNIIPLMSLKEGKSAEQLRPTEVYLGQELHYQVQGKYQALKVSIPSEIALLESIVESGQPDDEHDIEQTRQRVKELGQRVEQMKQAYNKLQVLKKGSIAAINQIRTISKIRVVEPRNKYDILYGIKLSTAGMDLVDQSLIRLFTKNS